MMLPHVPGRHLARWQISAWRDGALSFQDHQAIGHHLTTCTQCRGMLQEYEAIASVLRATPIPDPERHFWNGVQARITRQSAPRRIPWRGTSALVAALLFALIFALWAPRTIRPEASVVTIVTVSLSGPVTTAQPGMPTWGSAPVAQLPLTLSDGRQLTPTDVFPDGRAVLGTTVSSTDPSQPLAIVVVDLATRQVRTLETLPRQSSIAVLSSEPWLLTDGHYVLWGMDAQATGRNVTAQIGSIDLLTGRTTFLQQTTIPAPAASTPLLGIDHGVALWSIAAGTPLHRTDLATGITAVIAADTASNIAPVIQWPLAVFATGQNQLAAHIYNLATHTDMPLPGLIVSFLMTPTAVSLDGDTVYWGQLLSDRGIPAVTIEAIAQADQPGASSIPILIFPNVDVLSYMGANNHEVLWQDHSSTWIWERGPNQTFQVASGPHAPLFAVIHGPIIAYQALLGSSGTRSQLTVIDSSK